MRLALDGRLRGEERALVRRILLRNPRWNPRMLGALPSNAGIEVDAIRAGVQIGAAARALRNGTDGRRDGIPAAGAPHHLVVAGHVVGARREMGLAAGCARLLRTWGLRPFRLAITRFVLVPALPVFTIRHTSTLPQYSARRAAVAAVVSWRSTTNQASC